MDYDPQGSSGRWVSKRDPARPKVHLISAHERDPRVTRTFQLRPPPDATHIILDTPAAVTGQTMVELTRLSDKILVPVLPSDIDIHACSRCIRDLLLVAKIRRNDNRLGVIANRVKVNTPGVSVAAALPGIAGHSHSGGRCGTRRTTSAPPNPALVSTR